MKVVKKKAINHKFLFITLLIFNFVFGSLSIELFSSQKIILKDANDKIKNAIHHLSQWKYIDLCSPMLETGYEKFYGEDPLHMNVLGYSLLSKLIRDEISKFTI